MDLLKFKMYMKKNKITNIDLADATGYSLTSISFFLNGHRELPEVFVQGIKEKYGDFFNDHTSTNIAN